MGFVFIGYVIRTERRHRREDAEDAYADARTGALPAGAIATRRTRTRFWTPPTLIRRRQRDQVRVVAAPDVLDAVGQDQHALGIERLDGALVVRDEHDRALVVRRARRGSPRATPGRGCSSARRAAACSRSRPTRVASESRVFSPPESTPAGFSTSSPVNRNDPSTLRASVAVMSGAADIMFSSTERDRRRGSRAPARSSRPSGRARARSGPCRACRRPRGCAAASSCPRR